VRSSLARKYTIFTALLLAWVTFIFFAYDMDRQNINLGKAALLGIAVLMVAGAISRYTNHLMARPLTNLQKGISGVREGRLETIRVSHTGDEIEYLGDSLNAMIEALQASRSEVREHQQLLEQRIRQRTEALEEATQKAFSVSRAKSEFLANISHELRTPMSGVLGMIDIVLDSQLGADQRENLETAKGCANTLLALLNDILDLSKIEAGKMMLERIPYDVRAVAQDCVKSLAPRCRQKGIAIRAEVDPSIPAQLLGDPLRVRQILTNLLSNAVKFTERGGVVLRAGARESTNPNLLLCFEVADTGTGIPKDKQSAIFEEFTQADGSISRKYGGTGLGLAITRRLVEMHSGSIRVESEPGRGSTFFVELYAELPAATAASNQPTLTQAALRKPRAAAKRYRILVAEDNLVNQKVVSTVLTKHGYGVQLAGDGRQALQHLEESRFDLVLMDVQMPGLDGIQATRHIRGNPKYADLPVIAMTAHAMNGDRERCLAAGMNGYLSKPVSPAHLLDVIASHLRVWENTDPSPAPPDLPNPIDSQLARRILEDDNRLISGMASLFIQLAPERMQKLNAAAVRMDATALRSLAQKMAHAAERIAAMEVVRCSHQLVEISSSGNFQSIQDQILKLEHEITRLDSHVRSRVEQSRDLALPPSSVRAVPPPHVPTAKA